MSGHRGVDEVDLMLLDALHANPRISFERLGPALSISPATAARRWQRLSESGQAWVSAVPGPRVAVVAAVVEVRALPGRVPDVASGLSSIPNIISVYATDGEFDLHTLVLAADMPSLATLTLERIPATEGVERVLTHTGLDWHSGIHWHLGAIDREQQHTVGDGGADARRGGARDRTFDSTDHALFLRLQHDGRARYRELAEDLRLSEDVVRRRIESLTRSGMMGFRTDFTRHAGGWPAEFVTWLSAPHHELQQLGSEISGWPETRICLSTVGHANLMVMSQVHQIGDGASVSTQIERLSPQVCVLDQRLVLRAFKSWGRVLDGTGRSTGVVAVDPWA